jgi:hypothetical protein
MSEETPRTDAAVLWRVALLAFVVWALANQHECFALWAFFAVIS